MTDALHQRISEGKLKLPIAGAAGLTIFCFLTDKASRVSSIEYIFSGLFGSELTRYRKAVSQKDRRDLVDRDLVAARHVEEIEKMLSELKREVAEMKDDYELLKLSFEEYKVLQSRWVWQRVIDYFR